MTKSSWTDWFRRCCAGCLFDPPSLFAGKLHALLCRLFMKGRDWYDFIWSTSRRTRINHELLSVSLQQTGPGQGQEMRTDEKWCVEHLRERIEAVDWRQAREDVRRFIKPRDLPSPELWSRDFFLNQCLKLRQPRDR